MTKSSCKRDTKLACEFSYINTESANLNAKETFLYMAGTRNHIPVNTMRKVRNHTLSQH